jgi:hypothetical protein
VREGRGSCAPNSDSGREAKAKADAWRPQLEKIKAERVEAEKKATAEREAEAKKAQAEALAAARRKVEVKYWSFERDGQCTGGGKPPMRKTYEGGTFAEDELVAFADGCVHLIDNTREGVLFTQFCCPR